MQIRAIHFKMSYAPFFQLHSYSLSLYKVLISFLITANVRLDLGELGSVVIMLIKPTLDPGKAVIQLCVPDSFIYPAFRRLLAGDEPLPKHGAYARDYCN